MSTKTDQDILAEALNALLGEEWHQVIVNGKLDSSHASIHDAQKRMAKLRQTSKKQDDKIEIVQKKYSQ